MCLVSKYPDVRDITVSTVTESLMTSLAGQGYNENFNRPGVLMKELCDSLQIADNTLPLTDKQLSRTL